MCKETVVELKRGKRAAEQMVRHVKRMGAGKAIIPVVLEGESWLVVATEKEEMSAAERKQFFSEQHKMAAREAVGEK